MKYRLGDICRIEKGVTGITKAIPGPFPLVTTGVERKTHNAFQFDASAVIIPLVSGTGHGHASINRVHYQEGKFALGSILCAVIPKDEEQLNAKYLYVYFQRFKDSILVPLMKGAANVSLPMNKLAALLIEVPVLERQQEIIKQEEKLSEEIIKIESLLVQQEGDVKKLRRSLLRDAVQGNLIKENLNESSAEELLKLIDNENINKEKVLLRVNENEMPYEIPQSWIWTKLGRIGQLKRGKSKHRPRNDDKLFIGGTFPFIQTGDVSKAKYNNDKITTINGYYNEIGLKQSEIQKSGTLCITIAANIAECGFLGFDACVPDSIVCFSALDKTIEKYVYYYFKIAKEELERYAPATAQKNINLGILNDLLIPLPPLNEQRHIIAKIENLFHYCEMLEHGIRRSREQVQQLLQKTLKEALEIQSIDVLTV